MNNHLHNLDEGIQEYFEFIIMGHKYKFRYPNTSELEEIQKLSSDSQDIESTKNILFKFITKDTEETPNFEEISKQFTVPYWQRFNNMIKVEMSGNENNQSTESTEG